MIFVFIKQIFKTDALMYNNARFWGGRNTLFVRLTKQYCRILVRIGIVWCHVPNYKCRRFMNNLGYCNNPMLFTQSKFSHYEFQQWSGHNKWITHTIDLSLYLFNQKSPRAQILLKSHRKDIIAFTVVRT